MNNLKYYRRKAGLTQQDLSDLSGVSYRMICKYEQGRANLAKAGFYVVYKLYRVLRDPILSDYTKLNYRDLLGDDLTKKLNPLDGV